MASRRGGSARLRTALHSMPLQVRLIAILLVLLLLTVSLTTAASALILRRDLTERVDAELRAAARPVLTQALQDIWATGSTRIPTGYALVIMDAEGTPALTVDSTVTGTQPSLAPLALTDERVLTGAPFTYRSGPGSTPWRMIAGRLSDNQGTFALGMPMTSVHQTVSRMIAVASLIGLAAIATAAATGFYAVRRAFRPLREMEDTAEAIAGGDLTRRIPAYPADDEVASLSRSLNAMLAQIETSFDAREKSEDRMRQFVADASHELRTPLATVRGYAELYRQGALTSPDAVEAALGRIESEAARMSGLVEDLLVLARLDETPELTLDSLDLTVLAADAVADARVREPDRVISLQGLGGAITPVRALGNEAAVRQVLLNLLGNAMRHTPSGSPIEIGVGYAANGDSEDGAVLEVRDHGTGIPRAEAGKVFQRFYRSDPSRGRSGGGGNGLGLAIVAALVSHQGGRVGVTDTPGGGATFVVHLPRAEGDVDEDVIDEDDSDPDRGPDDHVYGDVDSDVDSDVDGDVENAPKGTAPGA
ncbi:MAG: HAMP domain-containing sensor histidine kinase [Actinomycetia bacterium]|nr:HAMP domain-containing sensor histidine kinase [Actinomycetes bacterium]